MRRNKIKMTNVRRTMREIQTLDNAINIKEMELHTLEKALEIKQDLISKYPRDIMKLVVKFRESSPEYSKDEYIDLGEMLPRAEKMCLFKWRTTLSRLNKRYSTLLIQCLQYEIYHNHEEAHVRFGEFKNGIASFHFYTVDSWEPDEWGIGDISIPIEAMEDDFKGFKEFLKLIEDSKIVINFPEEEPRFK